MVKDYGFEWSSTNTLIDYRVQKNFLKGFVSTSIEMAIV